LVSDALDLRQETLGQQLVHFSFSSLLAVVVQHLKVLL